MVRKMFAKMGRTVQFKQSKCKLSQKCLWSQSLGESHLHLTLPILNCLHRVRSHEVKWPTYRGGSAIHPKFWLVLQLDYCPYISADPSLRFVSMRLNDQCVGEDRQLPMSLNDQRMGGSAACTFQRKENLSCNHPSTLSQSSLLALSSLSSLSSSWWFPGTL